jgi:hypothetical protein
MDKTLLQDKNRQRLIFWWWGFAPPPKNKGSNRFLDFCPVHRCRPLLSAYYSPGLRVSSGKKIVISSLC